MLEVKITLEKNMGNQISELTKSPIKSKPRDETNPIENYEVLEVKKTLEQNIRNQMDGTTKIDSYKEASKQYSEATESPTKPKPRDETDPEQVEMLEVKKKLDQNMGNQISEPTKSPIKSKPRDETNPIENYEVLEVKKTLEQNIRNQMNRDIEKRQKLRRKGVTTDIFLLPNQNDN